MLPALKEVGKAHTKQMFSYGSLWWTWSVPSLCIHACYFSCQEVESNYRIESGPFLISWPKECDRSDVLELCRPNLKKLCSFHLGLLEYFLLGWSFSKPNHCIMRNSSHMERSCVGAAQPWLSFDSITWVREWAMLNIQASWAFIHFI